MKNKYENVEEMLTYIDRVSQRPESEPRGSKIAKIWIPGIQNGGFARFMRKAQELNLVEIRTIEEYQEYVKNHEIVEMSDEDKREYLSQIESSLEEFSTHNKEEAGGNFWIPRNRK